MSKRHRGLWIGFSMVLSVTLLCLFAPWLAPFDTLAVPRGSESKSLTPPDPLHLLGTDVLGRDLFSRVLYGGRVSIAIGFGVEIFAAAIGLLIGLLAGYHGGWLDSALMRFTDIVMAFPSLILAIGLIAVFQSPGLDKIFLVLTLLGWTTIARVVRGEVLSVKSREHIQAARALGVRVPAMIARHLLPNCMGPFLVAATIGVGSNIVAEAG